MQPSIPHPDRGAEARRFVRANPHGALSTVSRRLAGVPFGSIAPFIADADGCALLLVSRLAEHTRNLLAEPRCSLLAHPCAADSQAAGRVTLAGAAHPRVDAERAAHRYRRLLPEAARHLELGDFEFWRLEPQAVRLIAGFGGIHWIDAADYLIDGSAIAAAEDTLLEQLQREPALRQRLAAAAGASAAVDAIGIDPDGIDLRCDSRRLRLDFAAPALDARAASAAIEALAG